MAKTKIPNSQKLSDLIEEVKELSLERSLKDFESKKECVRFYQSGVMKPQIFEETDISKLVKTFIMWYVRIGV